MISVQRIPVLGLANVVNDPAFRNLIEAGYRPVLQIPVEEREGAPEIFVVMVRSDVAKSGNLTVWLLGAILLVEVARLVVTLVR